jgi:peptidoglycan/LPS O-acetylase OafA/YrhL
LSKDSYKGKYFSELNALRFIGFIGIFFGHIFFSQDLKIVNSKLYSIFFDYGKILGYISLDSFFVLSSFLITWKALEELKISGNFRFRNFLIRRTLRIWPLYFLIVLIGFSIQYLSSYFNLETSDLPSFWSFLFFVLNFDIIVNGYEFLFFMVFMWSISVEEQFYIFWAIILKFCQKFLLIISIFLIVVSLIFRLYVLGDNLSLNFNTISALGNFGVGAISAMMAFKTTYLFNLIRNMSKTQIMIMYLMMITVFVLMPYLTKYALFIVFQKLLFSIFYAFIILEQSYCTNSFFKVSILKKFNFYGKISYGLYCYHGIIITIVMSLSYYLNSSLFNSLVLYPIIIFISTLIISVISFRYYESKFLKIKNKY